MSVQFLTGKQMAVYDKRNVLISMIIVESIRSGKNVFLTNMPEETYIRIVKRACARLYQLGYFNRVEEMDTSEITFNNLKKIIYTTKPIRRTDNDLVISGVRKVHRNTPKHRKRKYFNYCKHRNSIVLEPIAPNLRN